MQWRERRDAIDRTHLRAREARPVVHQQLEFLARYTDIDQDAFRGPAKAECLLARRLGRLRNWTIFFRAAGLAPRAGHLNY
jgi:hypothetical protein